MPIEFGQPSGPYKALATEQIDLSTAVGFTAANLTAGVRRAVCQATGQNAYFTTVSGVTPTLTGAEGSILAVANTVFVISGSEDLANFRAIEVAAGGLLQVIYEGDGR